MRHKQSKYDIEGLMRELEVEISEIAVLFQNYIIEMRSETACMQEALARSDWQELQHIVHNVKGVSANLNINDVYRIACDFDILLKENEIQDAEFYVNKIAKLLKTAELEIRTYFSRYGFSL